MTGLEEDQAGRRGLLRRPDERAELDCGPHRPVRYTQTFVPLQGVEVNGDQVTVAFDKARVKDAPNIAEDGHLSPEEERQLYRYYGMEYGAAGGGNDDGQAAAQTVGRTSGVTEAHRHRAPPADRRGCGWP